MNRQKSIQGTSQRFKGAGLLNRTGNPLGSEAGFGVAEVVVAMGIFFFTALALVNMMGNGARINGNSIYMTEAAHLARHTLDVLMSRDYNHADLSIGGHAWPASPANSIFHPEQTDNPYVDSGGNQVFTGQNLSHRTSFNVTWAVSDISAAMGANSNSVKRILVRVEWPNHTIAQNTELNMEGVRNLLMRTAL